MIFREEVDGDVMTIVFEAESDRDRRTLLARAALLGLELTFMPIIVSSTERRLVLSAPARSVTVGTMAEREVCGLVISLAAALSDLHEKGTSYGPLEARQVGLAPSGSPVLRCWQDAPRPESGQPDDVRHLARFAIELWPKQTPHPGEQGRIHNLRRHNRHKLLALCLSIQNDELTLLPTMPEFVVLLRRTAPDAVLPGRLPKTASTTAVRRRRRPLPPLRLSLPGAAAVALMVWLQPDGPAPPAPTRPTNRSHSTPPTVTLEEPPLVNGNVISRGGETYAVAGESDVVVVGRWDCASTRAAVMRPSDGGVFVYDDWAKEADLAGRFVRRIPGATGLQVHDVDSDGCDELLVEGPDGITTVVSPGRKRPVSAGTVNP